MNRDERTLTEYALLGSTVLVTSTLFDTSKKGWRHITRKRLLELKNCDNALTGPSNYFI